MAVLNVVSLCVIAIIACAAAIPAGPQPRQINPIGQPQPINPAQDLAAGGEQDLKASSSYGYGYYGGLGGGYPGYSPYYSSNYYGGGGYGYPYYSRYYSSYPYYRGYGVGGLYGGYY